MADSDGDGDDRNESSRNAVNVRKFIMEDLEPYNFVVDGFRLMAYVIYLFLFFTKCWTTFTFWNGVFFFTIISTAVVTRLLFGMETEKENSNVAKYRKYNGDYLVTIIGILLLLIMTPVLGQYIWEEEMPVRTGLKPKPNYRLCSVEIMLKLIYSYGASPVVGDDDRSNFDIPTDVIYYYPVGLFVLDILAYTSILAKLVGLIDNNIVSPICTVKVTTVAFVIGLVVHAGQMLCLIGLSIYTIILLNFEVFPVLGGTLVMLVVMWTIGLGLQCQQQRTNLLKTYFSVSTLAMTEVAYTALFGASADFGKYQDSDDPPNCFNYTVTLTDLDQTNTRVASGFVNSYFGPEWILYVTLALLHLTHLLWMVVLTPIPTYFKTTKDKWFRYVTFVNIGLLFLPIILIVAVLAFVGLIVGAILIAALVQALKILWHILSCKWCSNLSSPNFQYGGSSSARSRAPQIPFRVEQRSEPIRSGYSYHSNQFGGFRTDNLTGNVRPVW